MRIQLDYEIYCEQVNMKNEFRTRKPICIASVNAIVTEQKTHPAENGRIS